MNIIELLKQQHDQVKDVLDRMIAEDDKKECRTLVAQLGKAMRLHMQIEEKMVYPAAARAFQGDEDDEESVLEAYEEHALSRQCLETLEKTPPTDKRFVVRAKVLKEIFEAHVEEEENDLLPELQGKLGQEGLDKLGEQVERRLPELERGGTVTKAGRRGAPTVRAARSPRQSRASAATSKRRGVQGAKGRGQNRKVRGAASTRRAKPKAKI